MRAVLADIAEIAAMLMAAAGGDDMPPCTASDVDG
jgi:hypothetical protein